LLANLYMRRFVLGWMLGQERSLGSRIVTYADDFVIPCRRGKAEEALRQLRVITGKLIRELRGRARIEAPVAVPQT
jgi:RNA-directed DNA polymerase